MGYGESAATANQNRFAPNTALDSPMPAAQISQRMDELSGATERLHERLSQLENRLEGVLRPVPPSGGAGETKADLPMAPLARGIREQSVRVGIAIQRIDELISRIEV